MADPERGSRWCRGTVAVSGSGAKQGPDMIVCEIERTRENLGRPRASIAALDPRMP